MSRRKENTGFGCEFCGQIVTPLTNGGYRNHCPSCLYSKHVDIRPGDRQSRCGGLMAPVGIIRNSRKGFQIVHRCLGCGGISVNKMAAGSMQPDSIDAICRLFPKVI